MNTTMLILQCLTSGEPCSYVNPDAGKTGKFKCGGIINLDVPYEDYERARTMQLIMSAPIEEVLKEKTRLMFFPKIADDEIRVFRSKKMKAYDSFDIAQSEIMRRGKDVKVTDTEGFYLVNEVLLFDGRRGFVWSDNQHFDE